MTDSEAKALDFQTEGNDLMDEDGGQDVDASRRSPPPQLKSSNTGESAPRKTKGRGFKKEADGQRNSNLCGRDFDSLNSDGGRGPLRSIEGWIVIVTGVHEEAQEDDLRNAFGEFGKINNLHLNLDRRTGFMKGYALIAYKEFEDAEAAIEQMNGAELLTRTIKVDWAFSNGPINESRNYTDKSQRRHRSRSPVRRY